MIYIGNPQPESYGISVIVDNLVSEFNKHGIEADVIYKLDGIPKDSFIIPYGIDFAIDMINKGYKTDVIFLADAFTLGYLNKIKFYFKRGNFLYYDLYYSIYSLLRDYRWESKVIRNFKKIALVSDVDINYLKKRAKVGTDFFCMPNGANFETVEPKTEAPNIRLGILSSWWHTTLAEENDWFIRDYFSKYINHNPNVALYLAGRGKYIEQYRGLNNVIVKGEVSSLNDFFKTIDVFVVPDPKGCGILNRVLDAFAYKTCVIGHKNAFSGFSYMTNCFFDFDDYLSFENKMDVLVSSKEKREELVNNAYSSIKQNNDWGKNISEFIKFATE